MERAAPSLCSRDSRSPSATATALRRARPRRAALILIALPVLPILPAILGSCDAGAGAGAPAPVAADDPEALAIFTAYCAACHRPDGAGTPRGAPPLAGSPWVSGSEERIVRIVLHGIHGELVIDGVTYDLQMPGFGQILSDAQIARVLSLVRTRFGAPSPPIGAATVARVRAAVGPRTAYWTVEELLAVP